MNMAHERKPPTGYDQCFAPNVFVDKKHFIVNPRATELTAEMIIECEQKYADIVRNFDSAQTPDVPVENPIDNPQFFHPTTVPGYVESRRRPGRSGKLVRIF